MQIDLIEKATQSPLILETNHNDPDAAIAIKYSGSEVTINKFQRDTERRYGYYGHIFDLGSTTNLDLAKVVHDLDKFEVYAVEPKIKANKLPEGAMS